MIASFFRRAAACALGACLAVTGTSRAAEPPAAAFDRIAAAALATGKTPGFSIAVVHAGTVVYAKGFGLADVEHKIPVTAQTRFAIGSLSKQFTAASILLLARRGKLDLEDPLEKYLPAFPNAAAISLRMLLNQTSGLHNYPLVGEHPWPMTGGIALDSLVSLLARDKPDFPPGEQWEYSNTNYALLSAVIAKTAGTNEATFLQRSIFGPLKMTASGFGNAAQEQAKVAQPYYGSAPFKPQLAVGLDLYSGAGAVVSSALDLAAWDRALMQGTLLDAAGMHALWTAGKRNDGTTIPYAMGFVPATLAGHREVWHNGLAPGAGGYCYNAIFPDDKLAVIVLSNGYDFDEVPERIAGEVLAAYDPSVAAVLASAAPPTPAPGEIRAVRARAQDWWRRLQTGTVDLSQVVPSFADRLTPEFLAQIKAALTNEGSPTDWIYVGSQEMPGATIYKYWIRLGNVPHIWSVGLTPDGKIAGSRLQ